MPPRFALILFRLFCRRDRREDIEGDLLERFHKTKERSGIRAARQIFIKEVLLLMKPGIVKTPFWLNLILTNLLFAAIVILPFLPGPYNKIATSLSLLGEFAGFFGVILIPIGLIWIIADLNRSIKSRYSLSIITLILVTLIYLILLLFIFISQGIFIALIALLIGVFAFRKTIVAIKKLKTAIEYKFNTAPVYLITIPAIALCARLFLTEPVSDFSRSFAIKKSKTLISYIEDFKNKKGRYPENLHELQQNYSEKMPGPSIMGIQNFRYNKINDTYSLSFSQWLKLGSLEEIVLYDKTDVAHQLRGAFAYYDYGFDLCRVQGAFASYNTRFDDWQYYHID